MNVKILRNILEANDQIADRIRGRLTAKGVRAINLISAPGSGKTSLLERSIAALKHDYRIAVLEGDIATTRDADRIEKLGVPVVQLLTGGACHLEAPLVERGLNELDLDALDLLFIENVGNIACPAEFDLGETVKVGILSVTEGHDKPAKYPLLFHEIGALVLNKIDLVPYVNFDYEQFLSDFRKLNAKAPVFQLSCVSGAGTRDWTHWLEHVAHGEIVVPAHAHSHADLVDIVQPHAHPHKKGVVATVPAGGTAVPPGTAATTARELV
ncbi:MAG TPA: hydrogenase nickel incorporation protein HypB [Verrucomicrobiae bacterium]|nr:hydrogenase nickel incorporation protein HypB [Verrucomicrobiae bacterium]